jgi:hypothetical protein
MAKDTLLVMCSPDIYRLNARRAINSVKTTDLSRAELCVIDNAFDSSFNHSVVMNEMLRHAAQTGRNLVILDDDVEIYRRDWLDRLYEAGDTMGADVVGCTHTDDAGNVNHMGEFVYDDGLTESIFDFMFDPRYVKDGATCVPTLCSAILLIRNCARYSVDVQFKKYKQDLDLCMQAWAQNQRVAIALDLRLIHSRGATGDRNPNYARLMSEDTALFAKKWVPFIDTLYANPELQQFRHRSVEANWARYLVRAARHRYIDKDDAIAMYRRIVSECFDPAPVAMAHFHLYSLTGDIEHLRGCNRVNPCHQAARQKLVEAGETPSSVCDHNLNCVCCHLGIRPKSS